MKKENVEDYDKRVTKQGFPFWFQNYLLMSVYFSSIKLSNSPMYIDHIYPLEWWWQLYPDFPSMITENLLNFQMCTLKYDHLESIGECARENEELLKSKQGKSMIILNTTCQNSLLGRTGRWDSICMFLACIKKNLCVLFCLGYIDHWEREQNV